MPYLVFALTLFSSTPSFAQDPDAVAECGVTLAGLARPAPTFKVTRPTERTNVPSGRTTSIDLLRNGHVFATLSSSNTRGRGDVWASERIEWRGTVGVRGVERFLSNVYADDRHARAAAELIIRNGEVDRGAWGPLSQVVGWDVLRWFAHAIIRPWLKPVGFSVSAAGVHDVLGTITVQTNLGESEFPTVSVAFRPEALRERVFVEALNEFVRQSLANGAGPFALTEPLIHDFYARIDHFFAEHE